MKIHSYLRAKTELKKLRGVTSFEPHVVLCSVSVKPLQRQKLFCLYVFRQAGPPQRVNCLAPRWKTALSVFLKNTATRYRIGSRTKVSQTFDN